jgi:peptidoglycan/LPS O-acetylase OafA/YrhL
VSNSSAPTGQRTTRRISWDIIRVVALLSVVLGHITHQSRLIHAELVGYPFSLTAQYGATALLVVSAYFSCASLRKGSPGRWLWNRYARLLPPYLIAVVITYVTMRFAASIFSGQGLPGGVGGFLFGAPTGPPTTATPWYLPNGFDLFVNLTMIQGWSLDFHYLDGAYWTLPVQLMAFTAAAVLWPRRWRNDVLVRSLVWALIVGPLVVRFVLFDPVSTPVWAIDLIFGFGLHRVHGFAIGVAVWLWAQGRLRTWHMALLVVVTVIAQDLNQYPFHYALPQDAARLPSIVGFAVLLVAICLAAKGPDWDLPGLRRLTPAITWLAGISYGVYLVHQELGYMLARALLALGADGWVRLVAVLAAAIAGGWLLTRLVERPAHRLLTRRREQKPLASTLPEEGQSTTKELVGRPATGTEPVSVGGAT